MIVAGQLMLDANGDGVRLAEGYIRVGEETIIEVVEGPAPATADFGDSKYLVAPGFIDAHVHLPQFDTIGAHGMPLLEWLDQVTFPAERKWEDPSYARGMTERVCRQFASVGTTGICAYATVHAEATRVALEVASAFGMRGAVGQTLMDRNAPDWLTRPRRQLIDESEGLLSVFPASSRMAAAITPRFAITCTRELMASVGALAAERGAAVQTHLAETVAECQLVERLFDGARYVQVYDEAGLVNERAIFGHGIYLGAEDREVFRNRRATVAHCPTANSFLRSGAMDRDATLSAGVRLALGSDIGGGYERSMPRVARGMIETASGLGDRYPTPAEAWRQITAGNAEALGWSGAGRLQAGSPADLVLCRPDICWLDSSVDPLSILLFAWDDRWIKRTWHRGQATYFAD